MYGDTVPNLNPPIFLLMLILSNPPNLIPARFSGYTVYQFTLSGVAMTFLSVLQSLDGHDSIASYKGSN